MFQHNLGPLSHSYSYTWWKRGRILLFIVRRWDWQAGVLGDTGPMIPIDESVRVLCTQSSSTAIITTMVCYWHLSSQLMKSWSQCIIICHYSEREIRVRVCAREEYIDDWKVLPSHVGVFMWRESPLCWNIGSSSINPLRILCFIHFISGGVHIPGASQIPDLQYT